MTPRTVHGMLAALALTGFACAALGAAPAVDRSANANRLVGTWEASVRVGPCGGPLLPPYLAFTVFHFGGTLTETNMAPLGGAPTPWGVSVRGPAFGTWDWDPATRSYRGQMRFNWYVGGFYHGYHQVVFERLELTADSASMTGTFTGARHFADGSPPVPNCGEAEFVRTP